MSANTTDEVSESGQAIAAFIEDLGEAVADSQRALDRNTAQTAERLSAVQVQVPGLIQEVMDDTTGIPSAARVTMTNVPMSTIILPMAYEFSRVFFQADLKMSEVDERRGVRLVKSRQALKASLRAELGPQALLTGGLPGVNAGGSLALEGSERQQTSTARNDESLSVLHFEATLEPRRELQVPTPLRTRVAPRITVAVTNMVIQPMVASVPGQPAAAPPVQAVPFQPERRTATLTISVFRANGAANPAALANLNFAVDAPELVVTPVPVGQNANTVTLTVDRVQAAESDPLPARASTNLRVTLGGITETIRLSI